MSKASVEEARKLAALSSDCSFLLTHLIRQTGNPPRSDDEAAKVLAHILGSKGRQPLLRGSSVGWYSSATHTYIYNPKSCRMKNIDPPQAVCFTESTLAGLRAHRDVFRVKYGLAFDRDWLYKRGANPCINLRNDILKMEVAFKNRRSWSVYNFLPEPLLFLVNVINQAFDATHEREWRFQGDLRFQIRDVMFVFAPEQNFRSLSKFQSGGKPVLFDLTWLDRV